MVHCIGELTCPEKKKKKSWSVLPLCEAPSKKDIVTVFTTWGRGRLLFIGQVTSGHLISYQGIQQLGQGASTQAITIKPYN